ncbi:MAG: hypothetical protein A2X25_09890 [Chloroflexi bacterium GWB2_49_20]|nr:MAG: hypothetical protein A2X25_09890 [Chloroflexi bacterium GWB2_49_20]OGN79267.1 MAG: hypothetical protein A2X26_04135 [Chloroflexi bacterium GWC2_49_37]OGN82963.1 MAG: hypothetical protein A2X27_08560 [Chloroflexi bacterium GWD2_49_16]HCC78618.1 hypothetical protein [Anaerolineae bacterium]
MISKAMDKYLMATSFEQALRDKRDDIAYEWYLAIVPVGSLLYFRDEAIQKFGELTDSVIDFLSSKTSNPKDAHNIGVNLAKLHVINARVITITGNLWSRVIEKVAGSDHDYRIYQNTGMMYNLAAGYFEHSRHVILTEQEQIRQALVSTVEKTSDELRNYQLHLEEILEDRTQQLQLTAKHFQQITETSLEGIFQVDTAGFIVFVNKSFSQMIGYSIEELKGIPFNELIPDESLTETAWLTQSILAGDAIRTELQLRCKNGQLLDLIASAVRTDIPHRVVLTFFITDISERIKAEMDLRLSENRFRTLAETAQALIIIINREDKVEYINSFAASYLGLKPEDVVGMPRSVLFNEKNNEHMVKSLDLGFKGETSRYIENRFKFPSGHIWLSSSLVPLIQENGEVTSIFIISTDITEIKNSHRELQKHKKLLEKAVKQRTASLEASQEQSRKLARRIVSTQEDERRRVSRELHDEAGQVLVSLKYELDSSFHELGLDSDLAKKRLASMMSAIDMTMVQIRHLSHSLRPPTLDVAGINLSLEDFCQETSERTGIKIDYQGVDLPALPDEIGISLYRIVQEALTNVLKHARASKASVKLQYQHQFIKLNINDNGKGIEATAVGNGIGLLGIRERVDILGGTLKFQSQPGNGTRMLISIPWQGEVHI